MKRILISAVLLTLAVFSIAAKSQSTDWKGRVTDDRGEPLPYANVVLLSLPDSTMIGGTVTELDGTYSITADKSDAVLMVSMLGFETRYVDRGSAAEIQLALAAEALGGASVTTFVPKTRLSGQGMLTSVKGSVLETVGTARDAISRVPGIIKTQDGLQVIGKGAPLIYINGRKVTDMSELDILQSNEIQSVEVITNPGAQYDATVRSVVRIKTIRRQGDGFSFNTGLVDEQSLRYGNNDPSGYLNTNYRHDGVDIFAGVNGSRISSIQDSDVYEETFGNPATGAHSFVAQGPLFFKHRHASVGGNSGVNWQINSNHSLGFRLEGNVVPYLYQTQEFKNKIYKDGDLVDDLRSEVNADQDNNSGSFKTNTYYNGQIGKLGIDFNADYYGVRTSKEARTIESSLVSHDDDVHSISHSDSKLYAAKLVLSHPVWKGELQAGTEATFSRISSDYSIDNPKVPSSESKVREDNAAAFANYVLYVPKVGQFSAGLRYEHVAYSFRDLTGEDNLERKYENIFPTVSYANAFGPVQVSLSYSSKTTRPDFGDLSSAVIYHSRYVYQAGNPLLQPQTNHDFGMNLNWKFLTMITQYSRTDDAISSWSQLYNDDGVVFIQPKNLESPVRSLAWFLNAAPTVGIWTINYTAGVQQQWLDLNCPDVRESSGYRKVSFSNKPMWIAQINNTFSLKKDWRLELGCEYHSKAFVQNTYMTSNFFDLNFAVQKSFFDSRLVLRLDGGNLLNLANYNAMIDCGNHIIRQSNIVDNQRVKFSLRYSFNTASAKYKGTGAGKDAMNRM